MSLISKVLVESSDQGIALDFVNTHTFAAWRHTQDAHVVTWLDQMDFRGRPGQVVVVPAVNARVQSVVVGTSSDHLLWDVAAVPAQLPPNVYRIGQRCGADGDIDIDDAVLGWLLGCYQFDRYRGKAAPGCQLVWPASCDRQHVEAQFEAIRIARDLVNTPANDMGPAELEREAAAIASAYGARFTSLVGGALLDQNFPSIFAVGQAASPARAPRLLDLIWGDETHPKVTLVGKGVCFDSGGLDVKAPEPMKLMKKDMGGAAHVLGLAKAIMMLKLPVRLRVLIPAVENMISGDAIRPMDIITTRQGLTVEIGNTDAEGRVILADALTEACAEKPDMILDFATLTGAARVALGTDLAALFSNDDSLANQILASCEITRDPAWRMPLWQPYRDLIERSEADLSNLPTTKLGASITAALFLETFVDGSVPWAHMDIMAWNMKSRPGRPEGGEANGLRAALHMLRHKYGP